ncbi:MAG: rhodanese-like domain-containing protein [Cyclobacteriaceae bacterium]
MISGARNIVYDDSFVDKIGSLNKEVPVFVYCAKGGRSDKAAKILKSNGFKEVCQLKGGIEAWKEAKMPLESIHQ